MTNTTAEAKATRAIKIVDTLVNTRETLYQVAKRERNVGQREAAQRQEKLAERAIDAWIDSLGNYGRMTVLIRMLRDENASDATVNAVVARAGSKYLRAQAQEDNADFERFIYEMMHEE